MSIEVGPGITLGAGVRIDPVYTPVTAGLQLYLDAQNYTGAGTTWTAQVGSNATLYNGPTYTAGSPTYFGFDVNSGQWSSAPNLGNLPVWTVESWFRTSASDLTSYITAVVCNEWDYSTSLNYCLGTMGNTTNISAGFFDGAWHNTSGFQPTANTWYQSVGTYDGSTITQYVNGASQSNLSYTGTPTSGGLVRIASRWDAQSPPGDFFPGDIAIVKIYNTALSGAQVSQNFNATRARFGI